MEVSVIVLVDLMIARASVLKRRLYYYDGVYVPGEWQKTKDYETVNYLILQMAMMSANNQ